ncbi:HTH-type transcriptional regulator MalT [Achromobacter aegrifaciens]|uniref:LuxR C-terminal-related transcriptional regulator n=1 Tax=Achromobacter aegrifaciens TaxID=1287736 RepID=UPI0014697B15|nr:LuxR C-terminal-related transcriptional regulator [Achromobacter aegrifaciens]CAB3889966.1 HTH-type transcriptional regulator MalT [Achromobacter aegrifaciens]
MRPLFSPGHALASGKLGIPAAHADHIPRESLCALVCAPGSPKIVLARGPAGYGKTTLLAQCLARLSAQSVRGAWLTLDRGDNDLPRFLRCLTAALEPLAAPPGALANMEADDALALALIEAIATQTAPFALVLDEFESIVAPGVLDFVQNLINRLPPQGRLLIGSRHATGLELGRLRADGRLLEIDAAQLCFSLDETTLFFARRNPAITRAEIGQLHHKTEGWIAALWLACASLARQDSASAFIERFSGSDQSVSDYLAQDVLAGQTPELRRFLLRTSILKQLNAALCQALLPDLDCGSILRELEDGQILLSRSSADAAQYRYHGLFASYLQSRLRQQDPADIPALHLAASRWYAEQGRPVPAIDHAIEGGDFDQALALLATHAEALLAEGRMRLLSRWFTQLPAAVLARRPSLQAVQVWATCFTRGASEASLQMDELRLACSPDPDVRAHVQALRPLLLSMTDRHEEAYALGMPGIAAAANASTFAATALANAMANVAAVLGRYQEAQQLLDAARRAQSLAASAFNQMYSEAVEGIIDLQEGRMRQAGAHFRMAVHSTRKGAYGQANGNAWAGVLYAAGVYEAGDLEQAARLLRVYVPLGRDTGHPDHLILGYVMLARIAFLSGDIVQTFYLLGELEYLGHQRRLPRIAGSARVERARVLLLQGHPQAAHDELRRAEDDDLWARIETLRLPSNDLLYPRLGMLRVQSYTGRPGDALRQLDADIARAVSARRVRRAYKLGIFRAVALARAGDEAQAHQQLTTLLDTAQREGLCRVLADEGSAFLSLLPRFFSSPVGCAWLNGCASAQAWFNRFQRHAWMPVDASPAAPAAERAPADALTAKELNVLRLVADGHSNNAIAQRLFVSESTVRTHLRNLNVKLCADSRTRAVALAREAGLL